MVVCGHLRYVPIIVACPTLLIVLSAAMFVFGVVTIEVWNTEMPVWAFILALVSKP